MHTMYSTPILTILISLFLAGSATAQHLPIAGTNLLMDYKNTGLSVSGREAKLLVNEANQAFLFIEQKNIPLAEFQTMAPDLLKLNDRLLEEPLQAGPFEGKLVKGIFHDGKEDKVVWFAYLGGPSYVVDIRGGYPASKDKELHPAFIQALRTMRIDQETVLTPFDGLPYTADIAEYGYTKLAYNQPNSLMLRRDADGGKRLIIMNWYDKDADPPSSHEPQKGQLEMLRESDREIMLWWNIVDPAATGAEMAYRAMIRFENNQVEVVGYGPWTADYLEELKAITRAIQLNTK